MDAQQPIPAAFNPLIRPYLVLYVGMILVMTIVLIALAIVWFCREALKHRHDTRHAPAAAPAQEEQLAILRDIRARLDEVAALLRERR